jgi:MoaA/NifB/PqqE/SkfB family radical SAM enzyme
MIKPLCFSPWTNLDISPLGDIAPCCKFQYKYYDKKYNIQNAHIDAYQNSQVLKIIKTELQNNQWPVGCERCKIEEENGIESKRVLDQIRWQHHYENYDITRSQFITASIAFGNTCNLKCITCGPQSSSRWQKEYEEIYDIKIDKHHFYKKDFVADFVSFAPNIVHLDVPGGEPFLSGIKEQHQLLDHYINTGQANAISLHYTTNITIWPDNSWWERWKNFKEIDLQLSIDGVNKRYEYIRFPADWKQTLINVDRYLKALDLVPNLKLSVSHTVSAYNIAYLTEFVQWCKDIGLPDPWLGRVHRPEHMRPSVWPDVAKKFIIDRLALSDFNIVKPWVRLIDTSDDSLYFHQFKTQMQRHDQYRGIFFADVFPEMAIFL